MNDEQAEQGRALMRNLATKTQEREEAVECIGIQYPKEVKHIEYLHRKREELIVESDNEIALAQANLRELDADIYSAIDELDVEIAAAEKAVKDWAKALPDEMLSSTQRLSVDRAKLTISKVALRTTYDQQKLLKEVPELYSLKMDGDPAVVQSLNVPVIERLRAEGVIDKEIVDKYRTVERTKSPSVRIALDEES